MAGVDRGHELVTDDPADVERDGVLKLAQPRVVRFAVERDQDAERGARLVRTPQRFARFDHLVCYGSTARNLSIESLP